VDSNPDVVGPNLGLRHFADGDDLGTTGALVDHRAHRTPMKNITTKDMKDTFVVMFSRN
jgi:hypothetical protein